MKIAVIGAGNVGATLGKRFAGAGHEVIFGVRNPAEANESELGAPAAANTDACSDADIVVLSVPYNVLSDAAASCGDLTGKIVVDATNPLGMTADGLNLTLGFETSGGEILQSQIPSAKVVKCFNTTGFGNMANPEGSMMFACGDDKEATDIVANLASEIGFDAMNIGMLAKARLLEPLAMLWIHLSFTSELKRDFAFRIDRR